jgi:hypothetical protein
MEPEHAGDVEGHDPNENHNADLSPALCIHVAGKQNPHGRNGVSQARKP